MIHTFSTRVTSSPKGVKIGSWKMKKISFSLSINPRNISTLTDIQYICGIKILRDWRSIRKKISKKLHREQN